MRGFARVGFARRDGASRLTDLDQQSPLRVLFPKPEQGEPPLAAMTTISGGLVGGDQMRMEVTVGQAAAALAIGQAAEKVYRSTGDNSVVDVDLRVGADAWLEWLPQETILFDGARLDRRTKVDVAVGGRLLGGECLVFGRIARDEVLRRGFVRERWEVRREGRLVWADASRLEDDILTLLDSPAGLGGARAYATALYIGEDAACFLSAARGALASGPNVRSGATCIGDVLVTRWLGRDPAAVRAGFESFWKEMRARTGGLPPRLPRLWYI